MKATTLIAIATAATLALASSSSLAQGRQGGGRDVDRAGAQQRAQHQQHDPDTRRYAKKHQDGKVFLQHFCLFARRRMTRPNQRGIVYENRPAAPS